MMSGGAAIRVPRELGAGSVHCANATLPVEITLSTRSWS